MKRNVYYVTEGELLFIFSCCSLFNWPMIDFLGKKGWIAWMGRTYFQVGSIKKKGIHEQWWSWQWKVLFIAYEITIWVFWCLNKLFDVITVFVVIYTFFKFKIWYCKKQHMYCFLPFNFINVIIFVNNPSINNVMYNMN